jgi:hypothetical protein
MLNIMALAGAYVIGPAAGAMMFAGDGNHEQHHE